MRRRLLPVLFSGSAPAFVPTDITGLSLWLDFSDLTTLFQDSARTTAVTADGQSIHGVTDKSGLSNHAINTGLDSVVPVYKTNIQNGLSVGRFDGGDILKDTAITSIAQPYTICIVSKPNALVGRQYILTRGGFGAQMSYEDNDTIAIYAGARIASAATTTAVWQIVTGVYNGASSEVFKNGVSIKTGNAGAGALADYEIGNNLAGDYGEVLVCAGAPSLTNLHTHLISKWGIT